MKDFGWRGWLVFLSPPAADLNANFRELRACPDDQSDGNSRKLIGYFS
jgi:hypothetical protein